MVCLDVRDSAHSGRISRQANVYLPVQKIPHSDGHLALPHGTFRGEQRQERSVPFLVLAGARGALRRLGSGVLVSLDVSVGRSSRRAKSAPGRVMGRGLR